MDLRRVPMSGVIPRYLVSTLFAPPPGCEVKGHLGMVRGIAVRSRNVIANSGASSRGMVSGILDQIVRIGRVTRPVLELSYVQEQIEEQLGSSDVLELDVRLDRPAGKAASGAPSMLGVNIETFRTLCENARTEAYDRMLKDAHNMGATAILGVRYESHDIAEGITEVLCYGSAVILAW